MRHQGIVWSSFIIGAVLVALPGLVLGNNVRFGWTANTDPIAGYKIHYGPASHTYNQSHDAGNTTTATVSNLSPGATYYFALTAYNAQGLESDYSNELTYFVPTNVAPNTPFRLTITAAPSQQVFVTVAGVTNRTFGIEATTNLTGWTNIGSVTVGSNGFSTFADTNAAVQTRRFYRARAL